MTDQSRPDPLGQDFDPGSVSAAPNAPAPGSGVPGVPDPSTDQWSAFDEPAPGASSGRGGGRVSGGRGGAGTPSRATPVSTSASRTPPRVAPTARKKATRTFTAVFLALILVPIAIGTVITLAKAGKDTASTSRERTPVALSPAPVEPTPVPSVPGDVTSLRIEVQGVDRVADLRIYSNGASTSLDSTPLPYAATFPVVTDDAYVSVTVDDYGYRGPSPMRCTIYAGDVVLTSAVGVRRLECQVSSATWQGGL